MTDRSVVEEVEPSQISEEVLEGILSHCRVLALRCDREGRFLYVNRGAAGVLGTPENALLGKPLVDVIPEGPHGTAACREALSRVIEQRVMAEYRFYADADGDRRDYVLSLAPYIDGGGQVSYVHGVGIDISSERRKVREAREADRLKDRFLAVVAHEMRNPLSAVSSGIKVLERRLAPAENDDVLQVMSRQVEHLARLVSDLLDVSRFHQGRLLISKTSIRISDVVDSALEICRGVVERKGHALKVLLPEQPIVLNGDKQRLSQVLVNLLDNAAKYTPDGGEIVLWVRQEGTQVLLAVTDDGIGIAAPEAPHIFEVFKQIERKDGSHKDGLGIGLYLVKMLIEAHGGTIEVLSDGAGTGSTFLVRLPCEGVVKLQQP
jgi:PAS domain S-box-containing protein